MLRSRHVKYLPPNGPPPAHLAAKYSNQVQLAQFEGYESPDDTSDVNVADNEDEDEWIAVPDEEEEGMLKEEQDPELDDPELYVKTTNLDGSFSYQQKQILPTEEEFLQTAMLENSAKHTSPAQKRRKY